MKKTIISLLTVLALVASGCTGLTGMGTTGTAGTGSVLGNVLGGVLGTLGSQNTVSGLLNMVIGYVQISESELYGTWQYTEPGVAFTSENLLAKAGGSVAAENAKQKLTSVYNSVGVKNTNTYFVFDKDHNFSAKVNGIPFSGTYSYDGKGTLQLQTLLLKSKAFITRTTGGLALTFESKNLLKVLQAAAVLSGNSTLQTVGDISKQYDGIRVGFEMAK